MVNDFEGSTKRNNYTLPIIQLTAFRSSNARVTAFATGIKKNLSI
jgi:DNA-binding response OmpR family regulator